jgi:hypothetical protein
MTSARINCNQKDEINKTYIIEFLILQGGEDEVGKAGDSAELRQQ